ncbi:MAG: plastocyanin/azurin family copper-binding protein [Cyanobacteriota bacterium]|mgnify:CR=1 FL=1
MKKLIASMLVSSVFFAGAAFAKSETLKIESVGDQMKFNKSEFSVSAGSDVTVEFKNTSSSLKHNWILVEKGEGDKIATEGIAKGEGQSYVNKSNKKILAMTKLADPGKTVKVMFKAPKKGSYDFVCTSPGHNMLMKGKLTVK